MSIIIRLDIEAVVDLPVAIPDDSIGKSGEILDERIRTAAVNAVTAVIRGQTEIDVSGDLGIPFHTFGPKSSLAKVFIDCDDTDVQEIHFEETKNCKEKGEGNDG